MQLDLMAITLLTLLTYICDLYRANQLWHGFEFPECTQTLNVPPPASHYGPLYITVIAIRGLTVVFWPEALGSWMGFSVHYLHPVCSIRRLFTWQTAVFCLRKPRKKSQNP